MTSYELELAGKKQRCVDSFGQRESRESLWFDVVAFTHVMYWAAQAGVKYAMKNP